MQRKRDGRTRSMSTQEVVEKGESADAEVVEPVEGEAQLALTGGDVEKGSPFAALKHRDYRLIWGGGFVSQLGSQMRIVAVDVQLWDLTHSFALVGLLGLFQMLPLLGFSLFGGVVADAFDRRKMMMITQSTFALSSALLAVATGSGWISPPLIYAIAA